MKTMILCAILAAVLTMGAGRGNSAITLGWSGLTLVAGPGGDVLADVNNDLWRRWDDQSTSPPPITEGLYTLYAWSDTAYGQVLLRAADWQQAFDRHVAEHTPWTDRLLRLRGDGIEGFRDRLRAEGFDCIVATKADDIGRSGLLWLWDDRSRTWQSPLSVLVLDAAGEDTWARLRLMAHPLDGVMMPWTVEVSKDCLEQRGLGWKVKANHSGFARMALDGAANRMIVWPT